MVWWWVAAAVVSIVVATVSKKDDKKDALQVDYSNPKVIDHYDKYVWNSPKYNPGNT